jgi:hypothetical protein
MFAQSATLRCLGRLRKEQQKQVLKQLNVKMAIYMIMIVRQMMDGQHYFVRMVIKHGKRLFGNAGVDGTQKVGDHHVFLRIYRISGEMRMTTGKA